MSRVVFTLLVFLCSASAYAQVEWFSWEAAAIRANRAAPVRLDVQAQAGITAMRLDFVAGGSIAFASNGGGRFTANIPADRALYGYDADDVGRNFVGHLASLHGDQVLARMNLFVNVLDASMSRVPVRERSAFARETARIINVHRPTRASDFAEEVRAAVRDFYTYHPDAFDFVQVVFSTPSYSGNRYHVTTRNEVRGIGAPLVDQNRDYGSPTRLLGVNVYPLDGFFDCGESTFSHETAHQWVNQLDSERLKAAAPHWPMSTMATGIMGYSTPGGAGGDFPYVIEAEGSGHARVRFQQPESKTFTDFDLYLMGLIPASEVRDGLLLDAQPCNTECTIPATPFTIDDLLAVNGPRIPSSDAAQKSFRVATIVITRDRLLDDDELAFFEHFAARGESRVPLPYTSGCARGTTNPFYVATRGLATVDFRLEATEAGPRRRAVRK